MTPPSITGLLWNLLSRKDPAAMKALSREMEPEAVFRTLAGARMILVTSESSEETANLFRDEYERLRKRRERMRSVARRASDDLDPEKMATYNTFEPERDPGKDVDVLVSDLETSTERLILKAWRDETNLGDRIKEPMKRVLRHNEFPDVILHLHAPVGWYRRAIFDTDRALHASREKDGIRTFSNPFKLLALAAESILSRRCITLFEVLSTKGLVGQTDMDETKSMAREFHWKGGLSYFLDRTRELSSALDRGDEVRLPEMVPLWKAWRLFGLDFHGRVFTAWDMLLGRSGC